jgi:uncharacterized protein YndB with AHSA1/START domain
MILEEFEPRNGGRYRNVHKDPSGKEFLFHGVYHEVTFPERILSMFGYEGLPDLGHETLDTVKSESIPGNQNCVRQPSVFQSGAGPDRMLEAEKESEVNQGYERLDELLEKIKKGS